MTMFEAFETPLGAREADRTWRGMVARARREYLIRLMPIWAAVLTLASLVLGLPGLYLLGKATGVSSNESVQVVLGQAPMASSLALVSRWVEPLVSVLSPTGLRFGLEAFAMGMLLMLGLAALVRAAGGRQWYQSVYDDIPRRRWLLLGLLWLALPMIIGFLAMFFGALMVEVQGSPFSVGILVTIVSIVVLSATLVLFYLTFSVREPAIPSLIVGAVVAAIMLCAALLVVDVVPGLRTLPIDDTSPFRALVTLSVFLFVFWSIVLAGSQLAVALARRHDPIERFTNANRGEQLDFALGLVRDLEAQTRSKRWAQTEDLALALAAPTAMVTFALDRLRRAGIVSYSPDGSRPPRRWSISNDLEALTLHDLSRAMGTNLDPLPGLHGRSNEDVIHALAEREHLSQTQNLLSLFRDDGGVAVGEPMLAVTDVDYRLGEQEAFASSRAFEPVAQVVDRAKGDNGGPVKGEEAYVFVDAVLDEDLVSNVQSGPSAFLDPDEGEEIGAAIALDLTSAMQIIPTDDENGDGFGETQTKVRDGAGAAADNDDDDGPVMVSAVTDTEFEDDALSPNEPSPLKLGEASPLAAVRDEIDNLLSDDQPRAVQPIIPMMAWQRDPASVQAAAQARARRRAAFIPAGPVQAVEPAGSWKHGLIPPYNRALDPVVEIDSTADSAIDDVADRTAPDHAEWLLPVTPSRSWRGESAVVEPMLAWKRSAR